MSEASTVAPPDDPAWVRPAVLGLLAATAALYLWKLSESGWANDYYSAAVEAGASSWKAFFFGSSDAANFITVDKAPAFLWPMDLSARIFGVSSWSILVPQALEGVATVGVLYLAVRRWFGPAAGLLAGAVAALTPVATLMFRFNNPDALLVLLLTLAAYAVTRAVESGATRWVVLVGVLVGFAFLAKMLQALLVVPAFALVYLVAAAVPFWTRIRQLCIAGLAMVAAAGWWVAIVSLWPVSSRPYIGGSQDNSLINLILGYNGFGRLTGNERGSVGGGPVGTSGRWGITGLTRLFNDTYGGQASWLIPAALLLLGVLLVGTWRAPRTDRTRAAALLWGGWLMVTGLTISLGEGIIHTYYTVALIPAIGALVGIGSVWLWRRRDELWARMVGAGVLAVSAWWSYRLLSRTPFWHPDLRTAVALGGVVAVAGVLLVGQARARGVAAAVVAVVVAVVLAGPAAYSEATVSVGHSGALPSAGPSGLRFGRFVVHTPHGQVRIPTRTGGVGHGRGVGRPTPPNLGTGRTTTTTSGPLGTTTGGGLIPRFPSGTIGGILDATDPSGELSALLATDAGRYTWVAATISANQAAGYQLATRKPVMAIGGFNGTDPAPTLAQFQSYVARGRIHYFIGNRMHGPPNDAGQISNWVQRTFPSVQIDGVTLYDLTEPLGS